MFGFLKDKLKKAVKSISERIEKKEEIKERHVVEEKPEVLEKAVEIEKPVEATVEERIEEKLEVEEPERIEAPAEKPMKEKIEEIKPEVKPEVKIEKEIEVKEFEEKPKKGFFKKVFEKVVKKVVEKKLSKEDVSPILDELENGLIESDVAYDVAEKIKADLEKDLVDKPIKRGKENEMVVSSLKESLLGILNVPEVDLKDLAKSKKPALLIFLGFNGSGKTTSLAKLAKWLMDNGYSCIFAAADTFRAAAEEQLEVHAERLGVKVIKHKRGADPAAVIYDAMEHAKSKNIDFVLADTAGRAHTNQNLMDQLKKIVRVNKPDLKILVMDSLVGNDAVPQAQLFGEIGVDGVIFTKVDVNEKGGAILSVTHQLQKPILFLGLGQEYKDFKKFDKEKFVSNLLG
jgi:fused signal recognition particle receptor